MKTLYLIRHAKSSWKNLELDDFDRPLNKRGKRDAPVIGARLKKCAVFPDIILCSPAKRAKDTAKKITKALGYDKKIQYNPDIYEASSNTLQNIINSINIQHSTAFLIGHNPGLNMLVEKYIGMEDNIPTCGIVGIRFACDKWDDISSKNAELLSFDYPKKLVK